MGEVFLAQDTRLDRKVALKILPPEFADDKDRMTRFVREAKSVSALNHPNIITIHEIGEQNGTHFIITEFIDGLTLGGYSKANQLDYKTVLEIAVQVMSALDEAHSAGIIHRDIKPDNIMVRSNGLVKILDFGIAKLAAPTEAGEEIATAIKTPTQAGMIIGTPRFMSPEQARGKDVDHQTDIFSFGVVLYEMLSGASPFSGETASDVLAAVLTKEPDKLRGVPVALEKIVSKTLQKDKRQRYQTAKELLQDLKEIKQELELQSHLERSSSPNPNEQRTQMLPSSTTGVERTTASATGSEDGFSDCRSAVQISRRKCRPCRSGRRFVRRNYYRLVALHLFASHRAWLDFEFGTRYRRCGSDWDGTRRALCVGRKFAPGRHNDSDLGAAGRNNDGRTSLGGDLRSAV